MTRVVLHIGDGKCGSSSIQAGLWAGRDQLEAQGILYRSAYRRSGHFAFVTLLGASVRGDEDRARASSVAVASEIRTRLAAGGIDFVVFSAESFFARRPDEVLDLVATVVPGMAAVDVVAYVREPADMYLSWLQQELKGNHRFVPPDKYRHSLAASLLPWRADPRVTSLNVRPFQRDALVGRSVVADFAALLSKLTGRNVHLANHEENRSLTAEQMVALQRYRARYFPHLAGKRATASDRVVAMFERMNSAGQFGSRPKLQARWADLIRAQAEDDLRALCAAYPDCSVLLRPFEPAPLVDPPPRPGDVRSVLEPVDPDMVRLMLRIMPPPSVETPPALPAEAAKAVRVLARRSSARLPDVARVVKRGWGVVPQRGLQARASRREGAPAAAVTSEGPAVQKGTEAP